MYNNNITYYIMIILILLFNIGIVLFFNLYCCNICNCCKKSEKIKYEII